jgi:hypothetical protein
MSDACGKQYSEIKSLEINLYISIAVNFVVVLTCIIIQVVLCKLGGKTDTSSEEPKIEVPKEEPVAPKCNCQNSNSITNRSDASNLMVNHSRTPVIPPRLGHSGNTINRQLTLVDTHFPFPPNHHFGESNSLNRSESKTVTGYVPMDGKKPPTIKDTNFQLQRQVLEIPQNESNGPVDQVVTPKGYVPMLGSKNKNKQNLTVPTLDSAKSLDSILMTVQNEQMVDSYNFTSSSFEKPTDAKINNNFKPTVIGGVGKQIASKPTNMQMSEKYDNSNYKIRR